MGITEKVLADHQARKQHGVTWFTAEDLRRLGVEDKLFTVYQTVQHTLKSKRMGFVAEPLNQTDRWSVRDL